MSRNEFMQSHELTFLMFNDYLIIDLVLFIHKMKTGRQRYVFQDIKKRSKEK